MTARTNRGGRRQTLLTAIFAGDEPGQSSQEALLTKGHACVTSKGSSSSSPSEDLDSSSDDDESPDVTLRHRCWRVVSGIHVRGGRRYWPAIIFELCVMLLIVMNVVIVVVDSSLPHGLGPTFFALELVCLVCFSVEYAARGWAVVESPQFRSIPAWRGRLQWALTPLSLLDVCSIVTLAVDVADPRDDVRGATVVRMLRVFSLLRLERNFRSFSRVAAVLRKKRREACSLLGEGQSSR